MNVHKILPFFCFTTFYIALFSLFLGCHSSGNSVKSRSLGAPGELLVVMDKDLQQSEVKKVVTAFANEEFPCVPQSEPIFKVLFIRPNELEGYFKAYRNIMIVQQKSSKKAHVSYRKNVWATQQRVLEIDIPDIASFFQLFERNHSRILDFLYNGDIKSIQLANSKAADTELGQFVEEKYGFKIVIPKGFKLMKDTAAFTWFRFDRLATSMHLILQSFELADSSQMSEEYLMNLRDSVGKKFIPGPSQFTYMQTEKKLPVLSQNIWVNDMEVTEMRGLWRVEGFFMGGPFVNFFVHDKEHQRLLMIDGFIYAPQKQNKAYYVRQVEAILHSVKI